MLRWITLVFLSNLIILNEINTLTHPPLCRIYVSVNYVIIGSGNGLLPVQHQAIAWTNAEWMSIDTSGTNFS